MAVIAGTLLESREPLGHVSLIFIAGVESSESWGEGTNARRLFGGITRKRRVHYHQVETLVGNLGPHLGSGFLTGAARAPRGVAGVEQRQHAGGLEQLQGAYHHAVILHPAIGHGIEVGLLKVYGRFHAGEGGACYVDGGGHDVAAVEHLLHHHFVQGFRIAAGAFVPGGNLLVDRRYKRARAAGEVSHLQLADGLGLDQSTPCSLATASRANSAADAGRV